MRPKQDDDWGWSGVIITAIVITVAAIMIPVIMRAHEPNHKPSCQRDLKELGLALHLYCSDYDGMMLSSILYEHNGWHWGDEGKGLTDGVLINRVFLDGHVTSKEIITADTQPQKTRRNRFRKVVRANLHGLTVTSDRVAVVSEPVKVCIGTLGRGGTICSRS